MGARLFNRTTFYHTWLLTPQGADCMVVMDEAGIGKDAAHLRETDESLMHRGHDLWLATLKVGRGKPVVRRRRRLPAPPPQPSTAIEGR